MQKATYYDNSGLFGAYSYPKSDSYNYGTSHQPYPTSNMDNEYQGPICPMQTPSVRPPAHKNNDLNGSCMRPSGSQSNSQGESVGEQPQAPPPLAASSPNSNSTSSQKKKSPTSGGSNTANPTMSKQIFPWMKETRQNSKQKSTSSTASTAGSLQSAVHAVCMSGCVMMGYVLPHIPHNLSPISHGVDGQSLSIIHYSLDVFL